MNQTHFRDPCIHCGLAMEDVAPGACNGSPAKAVVIGYASLGVRHDRVEHFRYRLSTNEVRETFNHITEHAPYYHFGRSKALIQPPPYDARLKVSGTLLSGTEPQATVKPQLTPPNNTEHPSKSGNLP